MIAPNSDLVRAVPDDYGSVTPYVAVRGAAAFLDSLREAFGAVERGRFTNDDGTIGHAEVWIGNRVVQMFDAREDWPDTPAFLTLYVDDCDTVHQRALRAGAVEITPLSNNAWGDRGSRVRDPFGNIWWIQSHVEDVAEEEMMRRMGEAYYIEGMRVAQDSLADELRARRASGETS